MGLCLQPAGTGNPAPRRASDARPTRHLDDAVILARRDVGVRTAASDLAKRDAEAAGEIGINRAVVRRRMVRVKASLTDDRATWASSRMIAPTFTADWPEPRTPYLLRPLKSIS